MRGVAGWGAGVLLGAGAALLVTARAEAVLPRPVEFPAPARAITVSPVPIGLEWPRLDPPPAPPIAPPALELGRAPAPRFISGVGKPLPPATDPGGFACTLVVFRRAAALAECGNARVLAGKHREAVEAFEESLAVDPRGAHAASVHVWLGELALLEGTTAAAVRAQQHYRAALQLGPPPPLNMHAELGLGLLALRRGDAAEAEAHLDRALRDVPPQPVALVARYLLGVARFLLDRPAEALALWDEIVRSGAPGPVLFEVPFWRGVALARTGDLGGGLELLSRFAATAPVTHPLRGDALVQAGWIALERGDADEAVRRFLEAEGAAPRPELRPQLRAGLVRAHLALGDTARAASAARQLKAEAPRDPLTAAALLLIALEEQKRGASVRATDIYREVLLLPLPPAIQDYVRYRLGEALEQEGRLLEAKNYFRELRDRGRDEAVAQRATYRLGLVALRENDTVTARRESEALLRAGVLPELREGALLLVAESAARGDDPNRAAAVLRTALKDYPDSPGAARTRLVLGWAILRDGDAESAIREWRDVSTQADPETRALALLAVADITLRQGRQAEALDALRGVTAPPPGLKSADAILVNRGILALWTGAQADAIQALEPLASRITDLPMQALARRALGIAHYELGRYDQAERQFRLSASAMPQEPSSWLGAGLAALAQNRLAEAEDALGRARFAAPDVATAASYGLVLVAVQRGDREALRERGTAFVDRFPRHAAAPAVLYGLVAAALERKDLAEGQAWAQRLLREHTASDLGTHALLRVAAAAETTRPDVARQAYRDLLTRSTTTEIRADASFGLAEAALAAGDGGEAQRAVEGFLREVPAGDPRAVQAHLILVRALEAQGQRDRAVAAIEGFLRQFPRDAASPGLELQRGRLLYGARRWDAAQQALEAARRADDPAVAAEAEFWLGEALRARGEHEAAIGAYLAATYVYPDSSWAARGLQGAAQAFVARQMPRDAAIALRKLAARRGVDPALAQWAREALASLGAGASAGPAAPRGAAGPVPKP